ncbi:hypothetical protein DICVIV_13531 [Dictyocaulus viviparus]|uniref:Uncharacterized protein n=1 Tax=Dictyocaulus viviparus TaxID=29172 RepID=A0A0D8X7I3_DICVI|nr:hypothetical protein DICVIV_13531 [Dictyocaulus viviparus]
MSSLTHLTVFKPISFSIFLLVAFAQHNKEHNLSKGDKIISFNMSDFTLPLPLIYTEDAFAPTQFPSASTSEHSAKAFARNLIARAVEDSIEHLYGKISFGGDGKNHCFVVDNTVTSTCTKSNSSSSSDTNFAPIPSKHLAINGALKISDDLRKIVADDLWPLVLNGTVRTLSSGPFGANFFGAAVVTKWGAILM